MVLFMLVLCVLQVINGNCCVATCFKFDENFLTISLHTHFTLLYWYVFNEGSFPGSAWVFSSFLHKEHNGWLASSPGRSRILSHRTREKLVLHGCRIKFGSALGTRLAANYTSNEEMVKTILNIINETQDWSVTMNKVWSWRTSVAVDLCTKVGHNFGCHMTPAEFYVSSDALVHLQIST